jgi:uncharacterized membrane protein YcaP (DUF421 family)
MLDALFSGFVLSVFALAWINLLIKVNGLRTLSKMTNFDFLTTIAFGSLLAGAGQSDDWAGFVQSCAGMLGLVLAQAVTVRLRLKSDRVASAVTNQPRLIMRDGEMIDSALEATGMRREDVIAKLREANVLDISKVRAGILETTGDVSIIHGSDTIDEAILSGVRQN